MLEYNQKIIRVVIKVRFGRNDYKFWPLNSLFADILTIPPGVEKNYYYITACLSFHRLDPNPISKGTKLFFSA